MKKRQVLFSVLFSFLAFSMQSESPVNFQHINLDEATLLGKKILISFSADWCLPCQMMDESIFSDQEISTLINENFTPIKADIDSEKGKEWNEVYNANYLPATLFASKSGLEIERLNGIPSREEFLALLKRILAEDKQDKNVMIDSSEPIIEMTAEVPVVSEIEMPIETPKAAPKPTGIVVQLGAFSSVENAKKLIGEIEGFNYFNHSIQQGYSSNNKLLYKVVLLDFYSEAEAIQTLVKVQRQGFDGFIKRP